MLSDLAHRRLTQQKVHCRRHSIPAIPAIIATGKLAIRQVPRRWQLRVCLFWATVPALTITAGAICYNTHIIDKVTLVCDAHSSPPISEPGAFMRTSRGHGRALSLFAFHIAEDRECARLDCSIFADAQQI